MARRELCLDVARGVAIFLVVVGHLIQFNNPQFLEDHCSMRYILSICLSFSF